jgi:hypothetical protein
VGSERKEVLEREGERMALPAPPRPVEMMASLPLDSVLIEDMLVM